MTSLVRSLFCDQSISAVLYIHECDLVSQAQIFLLVILVTAIFNYFIGSFIAVESKQKYGFFGYDGESRQTHV